MRTILVFPPRTGPTYMPLGIACLAAVAEKNHFQLELFDANMELWHSICDANIQFHRMRSFAQGTLKDFLNPQIYARQWSSMPLAKAEIEQLELMAKHYLSGGGPGVTGRLLWIRQGARILKITPEIIGFSAMYLDQLPFILAQAKFLRRELNFDGRIIIGGAAMSALNPVELLTAAGMVDAILTGEGEIAFELLLSGWRMEQIPGCYFREADEIKFSGSGVAPVDLGVLPIPDFKQLIGNGYFNPRPVLPIYGCRGCKWRRCRFCAHNNSFGKYRQRPARLLAQEMQRQAEKFGCHHFYMVDQYVDPFLLNELSNAILELNVDCRFQVMARTIGEYIPFLLNKAAEAGCCWISWGMESGSQRMLDLMNKGTQAATSLQVIKDAAAAGISNLLMMIFGAPGSDESALDETFQFLDKAWPYIDGMTASAFVLFEQTDFGRRPEKYGLEIIGNNQILDVDGLPIHDMKLKFRRDFEPGCVESPLAALEVAAWDRRKLWLPELPFHGRLCCEHYLLYADALMAERRPGKNRRSA